MVSRLGKEDGRACFSTQEREQISGGQFLLGKKKKKKMERVSSSGDVARMPYRGERPITQVESAR